MTEGSGEQLTNRFSWDATWQGRRARVTTTHRILWDKLVEHVPLAGRSYCEIGAGTGVFGGFALAAGAERVCLLDNSPNAIAMAREHLGPDERVEYVLASATDYRAETPFDVVLSNGLLEHFLDRDQERIVEAHVRNSADLVVFMVPASPHFNDRRTRYPWALARYGPQFPISMAQMESILRRGGLDPVTIERFYPMYGIKLNRLFPRQFLPLAAIDAVAEKAGLYRAVAMATRRLDSRAGGYLIGIGRRTA